MSSLWFVENGAKIAKPIPSWRHLLNLYPRIRNMRKIGMQNFVFRRKREDIFVNSFKSVKGYEPLFIKHFFRNLITQRNENIQFKKIK